MPDAPRTPTHRGDPLPQTIRGWRDATARTIKTHRAAGPPVVPERYRKFLRAGVARG